MAVTLTQLQAFLTVVRRGSVTAAAEELVVTQPSVSAAVSALERELGVELTERAGRSLKPTAAGIGGVGPAMQVWMGQPAVRGVGRHQLTVALKPWPPRAKPRTMS